MLCVCCLFLTCVICTSIACSLVFRVSVLWLWFMCLCFVFRASCLALLLSGFMFSWLSGFGFDVFGFGFRVSSRLLVHGQCAQVLYVAYGFVFVLGLCV